MPKQILLADDSVTIGKIVQLTFAHEDAVVTAVKSGDEALNHARASRPDIVLVDAAMPGKSGYEVCAELRSAGIDVPVLILTGNFSPYDEAKGKGAGADGNVVKPFETQALIDRVNQLVSQRSSGKPVAAAPAAVTNKIEPLAPPIAAAPPKPAAAPQPAAPPPAATPKPVEPPAERKTASTLPPAMAKPATASPKPAAPPPRATLMGIPTVSPTGVPTFSAPLPPTMPPSPAKVEPPKSSHPAFDAKEAATVVDMQAPALPLKVAPPKVEPPKVEVAPPPKVEAPKIEVAPPAPPPKAEPPKIEVAPPPKIEVVQPPPRAPEPSVSVAGLRMPRPSLIPHAPTPQPRGGDGLNEFDHQTTRKVDVPALPRRTDGATTPIIEAVAQAAAREAAPRVAEALGGAAGKGPDYEAIARISREVIEQIAWEVVPDLAEAIIKAEVDRLVRERKLGA